MKPRIAGEARDPDLEFLCVDDFLRTMVDARALKTAFELGLIECLLESQPMAFDSIARTIGADRPGLALLLDLLAANGIVSERGRRYRFARGFMKALEYRDLLEAKLDFAGFTSADFADFFTALVREPAKFMREGRLFRLFDYRRCLDPTPDNYESTRGWMRLTSTLTRYEARAAMRLHDFSPYRHALDVGGNSGEFLLQLCRSHPGLRGTVLDLPLVCEIGMEHVLAEPENRRIRFLKGDIRTDELPSGHDLVTFKSVLHDWPEEQALDFVDRAARGLDPGGTLLIFERAPLEVGSETPAFSLLPILLFFRSYRAGSVYRRKLEDLGFEDVVESRIELDSPFLMVTARKPSGAGRAPGRPASLTRSKDPG